MLVQTLLACLSLAATTYAVTTPIQIIDTSEMLQASLLNGYRSYYSSIATAATTLQPKNNGSAACITSTRGSIQTTSNNRGLTPQQRALQYMRYDLGVDLSDLDQIINALDSNNTLSTIFNYNASCNHLNISSEECLYDCNLYLNVPSLLNLVETINNETVNNINGSGSVDSVDIEKLIELIEFRSYSGNPLSYNDQGNYDMCRYVHGTYCYVAAKYKWFDTFTHGCCIPGTCTGDDAKKVLKEDGLCYGSFMDTYGDLAVNNGAHIATSCDLMDSHYDAGAITVLLIFFVFLLLVCVTSAYKQLVEIENVFEFTDINDLNSNKFVEMFCIQDNWKDFISVRKNKDLNFLEGLRFWSLMWMMVGHAYFFMYYYLSPDNGPVVFPRGKHPRKDFNYDVRAFWLLFGYNGHICVDTFFWLSGFLGLWSFLRAIEKFKFRLNKLKSYMMIPLMIVIRYLRLAPMLMVVFLISLKLMDQFIYGPHVTSRHSYQEGCEDRWVEMLFLYMNIANYSHQNKCMEHAWYLGCDFQFFLILPLCAIAYHVKPYYGMFVSISIFMVCVIIRLCYGYYYHFNANLLDHGVDQKHGGEYKDDSYSMPWTRMAPYFAGVFGYMLFHSTYYNFKLNKLQYWALVLPAAIILASVAFWPYDDVHDAPKHRWNVQQNVWYYTWYRPAWGVGLTLFVYALRFGNYSTLSGDRLQQEVDKQDSEYILIGKGGLMSGRANNYDYNSTTTNTTADGRGRRNSNDEIKIGDGYGDTDVDVDVTGGYNRLDDNEDGNKGSIWFNWENYILSKYLLSGEIYQPLNKLSYTMYLINWLINQFVMADLERGGHSSFINTWCFYCGVMVLDFIIALILYLVIEKPLANVIMVLVKNVLMKEKKNKGGSGGGGGAGSSEVRDTGDRKDNDGYEEIPDGENDETTGLISGAGTGAGGQRREEMKSVDV